MTKAALAMAPCLNEPSIQKSNAYILPFSLLCPMPCLFCPHYPSFFPFLSPPIFPEFLHLFVFLSLDRV